jgi:hypothetical protein
MARYRPLYRPAGFATLPSGLKWNFVEVPLYYAASRPDLPVSRHTHGVIETTRDLTEAEIFTFELLPLPQGEDR